MISPFLAQKFILSLSFRSTVEKHGQSPVTDANGFALSADGTVHRNLKVRFPSTLLIRRRLP